MSHANIQFALPNGAVFSIACIDDKREVAVINADNEFVPITEWLSLPPRLFDDQVVPISRATDDLATVLSSAQRWAERTL